MIAISSAQEREYQKQMQLTKRFVVQSREERESNCSSNLVIGCCIHGFSSERVLLASSKLLTKFQFSFVS